MTSLTLRWSGDGIARITTAAEALSGPKKTTALRRAINHTGDKTYTHTMRVLSEHIGTSQVMIRRYARVRPVRASNARLEFQIVAKGGPIPLKHFKVYQTRGGVSAAPWKSRKVYKHTFVVKKLNSHVFVRVGNKRGPRPLHSQGPIERVAGPNVPKELVKGVVGGAFQAFVSTHLPARVEHEVKQITAGIFA